MEEINGVLIAVVQDGRNLHVDEDGYIHDLELPTTEISIKAVVMPGCAAHPMTVDSKKNINRLGDVSPMFHLPTGDAQEFEVVVPVERRMAQYITAYPRNNMRFLEFFGSGQVRLWEAAITSQANENGGDFFFTLQAVYEEQCYRDGDKVVCPKFQKWPAMLQLLDTFLLRYTRSLPPIAERLPDKRPYFSGLQDNHGIVIWFNEATGMGALQTRLHEVKVRRFHLRNRRGSRRKFLLPGELVTWKRLAKLEPESGSSYRYEAVGVRVATPTQRLAVA